MASTSLSTCTLPEPTTFLRPHYTRKLLRVSLCRIPLSKRSKSTLLFRARVQREEFIVEERESEVNGINLNGNGSGSSYGYNGGVGVIESGNGAVNGKLVKYVNGNGAAAPRIDEKVLESKEEEVRGKKTIEEIGQEDAWFKRKGKERVEVHEFWFRLMRLCRVRLVVQNFVFISSMQLKITVL